MQATHSNSPIAIFTWRYLDTNRRALRSRAQPAPMRPIPSSVAAPIFAVGSEGPESDSRAPTGKAGGGGTSRDDHSRSDTFKGIGTAYLLVGSMLVGVLLGYVIDRWLDSAPVGMIISSILFIGVGMYHMIRSNR